MKTLGERAQHLRKEMGLNQTQLAEKIGISLTQLQRYENKGVQPPADILKKLADAFGTSIDYLVSGSLDQRIANSVEDAELIKQLRQIDDLPNEEKNTVLKFIGAYIRDYKTRQAYAS